MVKWLRAVACLIDHLPNPSSLYIEAYSSFHLRHFCVVVSARLFSIYHSRVKTQQKPTHNTMTAEQNTQLHQAMLGAQFKFWSSSETSAEPDGSSTTQALNTRATPAFILICQLYIGCKRL
jgi:hypothetical protein